MGSRKADLNENDGGDEESLMKSYRRVSIICKCICYFCITVIAIATILIIYLILLFSSTCFQGCSAISSCTRDDSLDCFLRECFTTCWKTHWTVCPDDGVDVCNALGIEKEREHLHPSYQPMFTTS